MSLLQRRLTTAHLAELIDTAAQAAVITPEQRDALSARFRAIPTLEQRRLDAWTVERAGRASCGFAWSPATARRILGNNALRRCRDPRELLSAVRDEVADQLLRAVRGHARSGSLAHWLAGVSHPVLGLITSALGPGRPGTVFAMLDVKNSRLHTLKSAPSPRLGLLIRGEAAAFSTIYAAV